ncbi:hypothetical protein M422DRAFT_250578 [Sphaerobolus stellatus SS14]|uniref:Zn(2)-C6 fungal-type domain-containing protein n=1 Tax=Sphaerobolus stellatus (strain SS14) TaxID=990650 RepID=A0A0C9VFL5_SPHS4|nr:hypothetical protein M422DRAFT_250578 [Sphaerobolus stellatus SS14]
MTDLELPAYMLAWKTSEEVVCMEEIPASDLRRTVLGFQADNKFNRLAPKFTFDDPFEEEEDRLPKVTRYWKVRDQERTQRESRYRELLDAEKAAALRKRSEEATQKQKEAQEEEAARVLEKTWEAEKAKEKEKEKAKGKEKEKEKGKEKEKEAGPSGTVKGKAREVPKTPKKLTPKKSQHEVLLESGEEEVEEEDEDDLPQSCIYCVKKKILCVPQNGKKVCVACGRRKMKCEYFDKTTWAVMEGNKKISESVRELVNLEEQQEASCLEVVWHDLRMFLIEVEQKAAADSIVADARVLQLLELKSKGTLKENTEDLTEQMDHIWKCTAWTNNGLYEFGKDTPPPVWVAVQGTKRKGDNEGSKKKKKKKVVETEDEDSTMR